MEKPLDGVKVKLGVIGVGPRGRGLFNLLLTMEEVEVVAISDLYEDRLQLAVQDAQAVNKSIPNTYTKYKDLLARTDIEAVIVSSSWTSHLEIAIAAMKAGKYVGTEVGGALRLRNAGS
ncbi:Gfo/Idh/MocA family protein [Paenibacillus alginolyticus]|uniref:Gfo/Idh/MocA family protein n=1 Tax=Paenibacillus alginolyticus TaxID=59839 RepID=UPI001C270687|nr:Gfo/Idh/MocA family oxidoreductase [Paenibacillus frigoriresistens]